MAEQTGNERASALDEPWYAGMCRLSPPPSPAEEAADAAIEAWIRAARFRRALERALRPHGLTFALWRVLHIADRMIRTLGDAVTQNDVARRADLHPSTISYLMGTLARRALVDRAPDYFGTAWRIYLTKDGKALLAATRTIAIAHGYLSPP